MDGSSIEMRVVNHQPFALSGVEPEQQKAAFKSNGPSRIELVLLWLIGAICFITVISHFQSYWQKVGDAGDNGQYISAAQAIQRWDFRAAQTKQGWGLSYLIALLSEFHLSERLSLLFISMASSLGSMFLARDLWGPWIAAFFTVLSIPWLQTSFLGGSEPLFVLLVFASFWFSRRDRWITASVLAALATVTRPVGVFVLFALGLTLLLRKDYRRLLFCTVVAALIGFVYLMPFWIAFHDPLYQFHRYKHEDWQSGYFVTWPFHIIAVSYWYYRGPWTNVMLTGGWIGLAAVGWCRIGVKLYRDRTAEQTNEGIFAITYLMFLFCYNSLEWARWDFPRFVIPAIPLILLSVNAWLPKSRWVIYPLCAVSSILAACSAIGIRNVIATLH
jgi:hypothetical protein